MPKVLILMGSDSDKGKMMPAKVILDGLNIVCEMQITSAHRTPELTKAIVLDTERTGCQVFICGAGIAAHLAGVVASFTIKPVIGVPLTSNSSPLGGVDALLATVQMPPGIPVATVGIDNSANAAWKAAQILALNDQSLADKILLARIKAGDKVINSNENLQTELTNPVKEEKK